MSLTLKRQLNEVPLKENQLLESYTEETHVVLQPPEETVMFYLLIRRRPREVFRGSEIVVAEDLTEAKKTLVEMVFGSNLPCTDDEILERYNVDLVEFDETWSQKFNEFMGVKCPVPSWE